MIIARMMIFFPNQSEGGGETTTRQGARPLGRWLGGGERHSFDEWRMHVLLGCSTSSRSRVGGKTISGSGEGLKCPFLAMKVSNTLEMMKLVSKVEIQKNKG